MAWHIYTTILEYDESFANLNHLCAEEGKKIERRIDGSKKVSTTSPSTVKLNSLCMSLEEEENYIKFPPYTKNSLSKCGVFFIWIHFSIAILVKHTSTKAHTSL